MNPIELGKYLEILLETRMFLITDPKKQDIISNMLSITGEKKEGINIVFKLIFNKTIDEIVNALQQNPNLIQTNRRSNVDVLNETVQELRTNYWNLNQLLILKKNGQN